MSSLLPSHNTVDRPVSPLKALEQQWVIGRGWVDKQVIAEEEREEAIREAMKADDQHQQQKDLA